MKNFLTQPRLQYFIFFTLILSFLGGVTSQEAVINEYMGPDVSEGVRVRFTGAVNSSTASYPTGISFFIITTNGPPDERICNMFFDDCNSTLNYKCYCNNSVDNTYYFVMQINATLERSGGTIYANIGGDRPKFPTVIAQTTTTSPTTVTSTTVITTPGTSTGSTDVTNDNVTFTTVTTGGTTNTTVTISDEGDNDHALEIGLSVAGVIVVVVICVVVGVMISKKKKESASVTSNQPSDSPAEEVSTVHSTNHNTLTSSKPEDKDKVEMTEEKKKKKSKKSTKAGSPKKKKKDFENGEKKMDENEPRCLPQPEPVAEPGLSTSLSNPEALKSNFATTRLSSPPSNTRPTSIEMTSAPRPLPSPRNPNM